MYNITLSTTELCNHVTIVYEHHGLRTILHRCTLES